MTKQTAPRATAAAVKRMRSFRTGGFASFKHEVMDLLGVPRDQFDKWVLPLDWQMAFCHAHGRKHGSEMRSSAPKVSGGGK